MGELLPIGNDASAMSMNPEYRIKTHCIGRLRREQPQPLYVLGDDQFDGVVRRLGLPIAHGHRPDTGVRTPYVDLAFGTTTARIFAGGPLMDDGIVELIEL